MKNKNQKIGSEKTRRRECEKNKEKEKTEVGGRGGLDPVRFGDWEIAGKCVDF